MMRRRLVYALYLLVITTILCLVTEYAAKLVNRSAGEELPFFVMPSPAVDSPEVIDGHSQRDTFSLLDPHLGYAHGESEPRVQEFRKRYQWHNAFGIYSGAALDSLERPVVLALGGSTTDPVNYGHSWPEELAKLMATRGLAGTVINGAVGGYSTNQELLKLIRDGLEFRPDIVISYSGVNDRGDWGPFPNPMVHPYQRHLFNSLTRRNPSRLMPNAVRALQRALGSSSGHLEGFTMGISTTSSPGRWYARNLAIMHAVTQVSGGRFYAIIQPIRFVGEYRSGSEQERLAGKPKAYIANVRQLYAEVKDLPLRADYVHDFTGIFKGIEGVYKEDGVHATPKGDRLIAQHVLDLITPDLTRLDGAGKVHATTSE